MYTPMEGVHERQVCDCSMNMPCPICRMVGGNHRGGCKNEAYVASIIDTLPPKKRTRKKREVLDPPVEYKPQLKDWRDEVQ